MDSVRVKAATIRVKVFFFGRLKELAEVSEESVEVRLGASIQDLFDQYAEAKPKLARYRSSLVASRNQEFVQWNTSLESGDEIAFLPPVSGG